MKRLLVEEGKYCIPRLAMFFMGSKQMTKTHPDTHHKVVTLWKDHSDCHGEVSIEVIWTESGPDFSWSWIFVYFSMDTQGWVWKAGK